MLQKEAHPSFLFSAFLEKKTKQTLFENSHISGSNSALSTPEVCAHFFPKKLLSVVKLY